MRCAVNTPPLLTAAASQPTRRHAPRRAGSSRARARARALPRACGLLIAAAWTCACGRGPAANPAPPRVDAQAVSVARGRALYREQGCAVCHGPEGHGDGPAARGLVDPPRDLRDAASYTHGATAPAIAATLGAGISTLRGGMPAYNHLNDADRAALAAFVVDLQHR